MDTILSVNNVKKYYGKDNNLVKAVNDISFNVQRGELLAVTGSSGSGKSTLLNLLSSIDIVDSGNILINNEDLTKMNNKQLLKFRREKLGFVFQDLNLLNTLTLYENIQLSLSINRCNPKVMDDKIQSISKKLGIDNILNKYPYEVSGGQKQRCSCARAIINNPDIILADEPTGALDSKSAKNLLKILQNINKEFNATVIIVTHDSYVASYCSRVLFIKDGKIVTELKRHENNKEKLYKEILSITSEYSKERYDDVIR
ncbi:ABC transporter ATP-binding protein [Clostridium sp. Marseille-Q2269]|uniref:ABC transporter ATP-binding protein n=1 Tax=Clostridium sp. Marseille-Q2269 TaxID=2942205 RepID=UPI0020730D76|nr:ABC transporter ATP-binding protein [Clostridium sp. Marseille-Q2269]